jgi:hypothetical protein
MRRRAAAPAEAGALSEAIAAPSRPPLGAPPARAEAADEAELDALRGELVRELDRMAADAGDSASLRRGDG